MATIKATLQNLKNNGPGYYPCLVGGWKLKQTPTVSAGLKTGRI